MTITQNLFVVEWAVPFIDDMLYKETPANTAIGFGT